MTRYKPAGPLLAIEPPSEAVEEVRMRALSRDTSEVLTRVQAGSRVIVTKRGAPVAVMLELEEALGMAAAVVVPKREAERWLFGGALAPEFLRRKLKRLARARDRRRDRGEGVR